MHSQTIHVIGLCAKTTAIDWEEVAEGCDLVHGDTNGLIWFVVHQFDIDGPTIAGVVGAWVRLSEQ